MREPTKPRFCTPSLHFLDKDAQRCVCGELTKADPDHEAKQRAAQGWTWVQPSDRATLLLRLAQARDSDVPARERENLCSVAHGEISRLAEVLQDLVDDSYSLIAGEVALGLGVFRCHQCEATKGGEKHPHAPYCAVGRAEDVLARKSETRPPV